MLDVNPSDRATPPSVRRPDTAARMPQVADVQAMLPLASPSVRVAILLAVATGMRRGELMALRWSSVDLDVGVVAVRQAAVKVPGARAVVRAPKSEAGQRTVTLPPSMVDALRAHLARRNEWITANTTHRPPTDGPVLAHLRADPSGRTAYSPDWLSQEWERLRDRIGRPQLQWKGLRALHASLLAEAQVSPAALAQRQGHAQVSTTLNYYTMEIAGADRAAAQALEVVMGRLGPDR
jgi:integrase